MRCTKCGRDVITLGFKLCVGCRMAERERAKAHRSQGGCADCRQPALPDESRCKEHKEARRVKRRKEKTMDQSKAAEKMLGDVRSVVDEVAAMGESVEEWRRVERDAIISDILHLVDPMPDTGLLGAAISVAMSAYAMRLEGGLHLEKA